VSSPGIKLAKLLIINPQSSSSHSSANTHRQTSVNAPMRMEAPNSNDTRRQTSVRGGAELHHRLPWERDANPLAHPVPGIPPFPEPRWLCRCRVAPKWRWMDCPWRAMAALSARPATDPIPATDHVVPKQEWSGLAEKLSVVRVQCIIRSAAPARARSSRLARLAGKKRSLPLR
jgi:hypothetical protein